MDILHKCRDCEHDDHEFCSWFDGADCDCDCHDGLARFEGEGRMTMDEPPNVAT